MNIRIEGTEKECREVEKTYREMERNNSSLIVIISPLYPNRGSDKIFRMYITIRSE